ncbi:DUF2839 family protein [Leptolyngbyaceae cyanobacterium CCMR0082]|uniref:DUF2839 family protein n=2 Tax=Adonisia turfae TaxID=2950184 RepID=A0A6M0S298_9CYAN|nr:DUF2839 domain-containing protein [Adonisia turfae]EKV02898.1 Protein of unknown function (DUF2839) [Leptolyngbya sp. PCC 7375]MDV3347727.1 DUF2839 domain-containing protein [Leptothoe sp. LEGE 181152]NEZ60478.1 DUF2839 family protein [Adonisia turfae CCMR0081]NEZ62604.1 DUF2839 family protein [Adonisia turfae CCMR0082]
MGEAKRRQSKLGEDYGKAERIFPWLPITKKQSQAFVTWSTRGAWAGIILMILLWLTVRFIGPAFGWWALAE